VIVIALGGAAIDPVEPSRGEVAQLDRSRRHGTSGASVQFIPVAQTMSTRILSVTLTVGAVLLASACAAPEPARQAAPTQTQTQTPSLSPAEEELCQPFPDVLFDGFLNAYRERDLETLRSLVHVEGIRDVSAIASSSRVEFDDVADWAQAGWEDGDRLKPKGYGAFAGGPGGFVMYLERTSDALRDVGIPKLGVLIQANSTGCIIDKLSSVGPAQADGAPCLFYEVFGDHRAVAAEEPPGCADGSGAFARIGHASTWIGDEVVITGGTRGGHLYPPDQWETGLRYDGADGWRPTSEVPSAVRSMTRATWSGTEVLVWGGYWAEGAAAAYDPARDRWRVFPSSPLRRSDDSPGVWTGQELIVWGSSSHTDEPGRRGAILDPETGSWRLTAPAPIAGRSGHLAVWTGTEMIVWGGSNYRTDLDDGAAYTPETDTWRKIAASLLTPRDDATVVWTGEEMLVWGGSSFSSTRADGAAYDPEIDRWRRLSEAPIDDRHWHTAVWTGSEMIVWGGHSYRTEKVLGDGAAYDPRRDRWNLLPVAPITARCRHSATWTGRTMVIYGGHEGCGSGGHIPFGDGAALDPEAGTWHRLNPAA
jgi:hypothetical protein